MAKNGAHELCKIVSQGMSRAERVRRITDVVASEDDLEVKLIAKEMLWRLQTVFVGGKERLNVVKCALIEYQSQDLRRITGDQEVVAELLAEINAALEVTP